MSIILCIFTVVSDSDDCTTSTDIAYSSCEDYGQNIKSVSRMIKKKKLSSQSMPTPQAKKKCVTSDANKGKRILQAVPPTTNDNPPIKFFILHTSLILIVISMFVSVWTFCFVVHPTHQSLVDQDLKFFVSTTKDHCFSSSSCDYFIIFIFLLNLFRSYKPTLITGRLVLFSGKFVF